MNLYLQFQAPDNTDDPANCPSMVVEPQSIKRPVAVSEETDEVFERNKQTKYRSLPVSPQIISR